MSDVDQSIDRKDSTGRNGSIARGGIGWKLPVSRPGANHPRGRLLSQSADTHVERSERPMAELDRSLDQKIATASNGSIARGGLGGKLQIGRRGASGPRERPLSESPDTRVERGERPVTELHRSIDRKIATASNGSVAFRRSHE